MLQLSLVLALACAPNEAALLPAQNVLVLTADRWLDVEAGVVREDAVLVIEGERIRSVGEDARPEGATVIELGDVCLLPGLIDMHTHLTGALEGDWTTSEVRRTIADGALLGARNARRTLEAGFTTVRDLGAGGFADVSLMKAIEAGWVEGPRMFPAGHALGITGGHMDITGYAPGVRELGPEEGVADGPAQFLRAARYQIKHGVRVIKIGATAGVLSHEESVGAQQMSREELEVVVEEAHRHGLRVAAHAHGTEGILAAVRAGVDSIEHGSILDAEAIALMKERGTYLVPTAYIGDAVDLDALPPLLRSKAELVIPQARESLRAAIAAGVPIALGTDAAVIPHGDNAKELAVYVAAGMSPLEALRSATMNAADLLGVDDRGRLAPGTLADVIAVPGDPLADVRVAERVSFVMKGGRVVRGAP